MPEKKRKKFIKKIVIKYKDTVKSNLQILNSILSSADIDGKLEKRVHQKVLTDSSKLITEKWQEEKKYLRTVYVAQAFDYKVNEENILISTIIDTIINILDDLLDEKLDQEEKVLYIFELVRVLGLFTTKGSTKKLQKRLGLYLHKLISLAILEPTYLQKIIEINDEKKMLSLSINLILSRAKDIDIFIEIFLGLENKETDSINIINISRIFRAVNIIKKDILDIKHDNESGQETLITFAYNNDSVDFSKFVSNIIFKINELIKPIKEKTTFKDKKRKRVFYNFLNMIDSEIVFIKSYIKNIQK